MNTVMKLKTTVYNRPLGTIIEDSNAVLDYLCKNPILVKGKGSQLPQNKLGSLNQLLTNPLQHNFKRPQSLFENSQ